MEQWKNKVAVVTGASSGIGASIALELTKSGMIVIGLARRKDRIDALRAQLAQSCANNLHALHCDITSEDSVKTAFRLIEQNFGGVDVLVNNAGVLKMCNLVDMDNMAKIRETVDTNVLGLVMCTREAFQSMKRRHVNGHVVLINSILGHDTPYVVGKLPSYNMYNASKYAVTALTEVYRQEFQIFGNKVKISVNVMQIGKYSTYYIVCVSNNVVLWIMIFL